MNLKRIVYIDSQMNVYIYSDGKLCLIWYKILHFAYCSTETIATIPDTF